jgi:hypothetical protein
MTIELFSIAAMSVAALVIGLTARAGDKTYTQKQTSPEAIPVTIYDR